MIKQTLVGQKGSKSIYYYKFTNATGSNMTVTNYGATIVSIMMPDRNDNLGDVVFSLSSIEEYMENTGYLGSTVGRVASRIKEGIVEINDIKYDLQRNEGRNHLHGGIEGFDKKVWDSEIKNEKLILKYHSPDGEEGYPGILDVRVTFELTDMNEIDIHYVAVSDSDTVVNMTNHSYFNLNGRRLDVKDSMLNVYADHYTPVGVDLIPTGEILSVGDTPLDFRLPRRIGECQNHKVLDFTNGYDHNFVLNGEGMRKCAELYDERAGRRLIVYTDQPCMQVYTAQNLGSSTQYAAICLETQLFPDAMNHDTYPSYILEKGKEYMHNTKYSFSK